MVELATGVCATPREALRPPCGAARRRGRGRADERPAHRRRRHAPVQPPAGAGHRARPALPGVRRVRGHHGQAAGASAGCTSTSACPGPRSACARSRASCPGCRSCSRCRRTRPTSPARRRASRRRGPRCSRCCRAPRRRRCSARTRSGRRSSSASSDRARRRLHALLVGHPAAPALRHARGARARPADRRRAHGGLRRAAAGALRDRRSTASRPRPAEPRRLRAEPLGRAALRAARGADPSRRRPARRRRGARRTSCSR